MPVQKPARHILKRPACTGRTFDRQASFRLRRFQKALLDRAATALATGDNDPNPGQGGGAPDPSGEGDAGSAEGEGHAPSTSPGTSPPRLARPRLWCPAH
jgi:hypothetical protein